MAGPPSSANIEKIPENEDELQFPIGRVARLLKEGNYAEHVGVGASVYLTAVLEYLAAEFLELSGNAATEDNSATIKSRHIHSGWKNDAALTELLERTKIVPGHDIEDNGLDGDYSDDYEFDSNDEDEDDSDMIGKGESVELEMELNELSADTNILVAMGQMNVALGQVELYRRLVDQFGDIVPPDLPKFKVDPTCAALNGLLNVVSEMIKTTPDTISQELVSYWEGMAAAYSDMGLKLGWFQEYVQKYRNWLIRRPAVDMVQLTRIVAVKKAELEDRKKKVGLLEKEVEELSEELHRAQNCQSQFGFSLFND
ncbi:hypothetical protein ACHQM5_017837 [Ranunculus cassubicifolius]